LLKIMVQALKLAAVLVLAVAVVVTTQRTLAGYLEQNNAAVGQPVVFTIQPDETVDSIANRLHDAGLIRSTTYFKFRIRLANADTKIRAGRYVLYQGMSVSQIIHALTTPEQVQVVRVRFQEGWRAEEYAEKLVEVGLIASPDEFLSAIKNSSKWKAQFDFLSDLPDGASLEGYLFPDTYEFRADANVDDIIVTMLQNFGQRVPASERSKAKTLNRSFYDVLKVASLVEREAAVDQERPIIASVFYNRLKEGMPLQSDPTVQYAAGSAGNWWPTVTPQLIDKVNSPYNTYKATGLPPTPICNPSLASIEAALNPAQTNYLYFVAKGDGSGEHLFAATYDEHVKNINKVQRR